MRILIRSLAATALSIVSCPIGAQFAPENGAVADPNNPSSATRTVIDPHGISKLVDHYYYDCLKKKWVWVSREWSHRNPPAFTSEEWLPGPAGSNARASPDLKELPSGPPPGAQTSATDPHSAFDPKTGQNFAKEPDGSWIDVKTGKTAGAPKLCPCPEPQTTPQPSPTENPPPKKLDKTSQRILEIHNEERFAVHVPPLRWNFQLEQDATQWADQLAITRQLTHAPREGRGIERENLLQALPGWSADRMMQSWTMEKRDFTAGYYPNVALDGNWLNVSHYTQMIWPTTTDIGCGYAEGGEYEWLVCRYSPGGNKDGKPVGMSYPTNERG